MARINLTVGKKTTIDASASGYVAAMNAQMKTIQDNFIEIMRGTNNLLPGALAHGVEPIFDESQRLVPVRTGALKSSGFVDARQTARGARVTLGYGRGGFPSYAALVHEGLQFFHKAPTQAKFLSQAVANFSGLVLPRVAQWMRASIAGASN